MYVPTSVVGVPAVVRAVDFVRPVLERLGLPILTAPPEWHHAPGNAVGDIEKRGLFIYLGRKYNVYADGGWIHLAFDLMHEVAHLVAADGDTVAARSSSVNYDEESTGVLQVEVRLWGSLGQRWEWFVSHAENDYGYSLDDFQDYAFESHVTRDLVKRGLLTPHRETIRWSEARRHIHSVRP